MIVAMSIVVIAWVVVFCLIAGWGQISRAIFGLRAGRFESWFDAFWIGFAAVIAALQLLHLALPIDWRICAVLGVIGLIGLIWAVFRRETSRLSVLRLVIFMIVIAPVAIWVANRALSP